MRVCPIGFCKLLEENEVELIESLGSEEVEELRALCEKEIGEDEVELLDVIMHASSRLAIVASASARDTADYPLACITNSARTSLSNNSAALNILKRIYDQRNNCVTYYNNYKQNARETNTADNTETARSTPEPANNHIP